VALAATVGRERQINPLCENIEGLMSCFRVGLGALIFALSSASAYAQTAQLSGYIKDPSGLSVASAAITIVNKDNGVKGNTKSNDNGLYVAPLLEPGYYQGLVKASGFQALSRTGITLEVVENARMDFTLQVGHAWEAINVEEGATKANTIDGSVGTAISREFVDNVPLNGRTFHSLITLAPGVVETSTGGRPDVTSKDTLEPTQPFVDNVIPANRINPHMQRLRGISPHSTCRVRIHCKPYPGPNHRLHSFLRYSSNNSEQTPLCDPGMGKWEVFFWGCFGNALLFLYALLRHTQSREGRPPYYRSPLFWIVSFVFMLFCGGLAVALHANTPFLAIHIGASAPLLIALLAPEELLSRWTSSLNAHS
jgi:Carboxypeptidase regulatory-like domain